jgi:hypothetical protein
MNLGEVKAQFKGLLNNTVVNNNSALVTTFINQGIMRIQRELRVPFMEKQILYTIPANYTKLAIPGDLLELISIQVDRDADNILEYELQRTDLNRVMAAVQVPGVAPEIFARQGGSWFIGPEPVTGDQVLITYYAEFAALTSDADQNTATKVAWDAVVYAALTAATEYLNDDRHDAFDARYKQIVLALQSQADADELSADAAIRPALYYEDENW